MKNKLFYGKNQFLIFEFGIYERSDFDGFQQPAKARYSLEISHFDFYQIIEKKNLRAVGKGRTDTQANRRSPLGTVTATPHYYDTSPLHSRDDCRILGHHQIVACDRSILDPLLSQFAPCAHLGFGGADSGLSLACLGQWIPRVKTRRFS